MAKRTKCDAIPADPTRYAFETYWRPTPYVVNSLIEGVPGVWNGQVNVRRWRVTIEPVAEAPEVLYARLLDMWERSANHHEFGPLKAAARAHGGRAQDRLPGGGEAMSEQSPIRKICAIMQSIDESKEASIWATKKTAACPHCGMAVETVTCQAFVEPEIGMTERLIGRCPAGHEWAVGDPAFRWEDICGRSEGETVKP